MRFPADPPTPLARGCKASRRLCSDMFQRSLSSSLACSLSTSSSREVSVALYGCFGSSPMETFSSSPALNLLFCSIPSSNDCRNLEITASSPSNLPKLTKYHQQYVIRLFKIMNYIFIKLSAIRWPSLC